MLKVVLVDDEQAGLKLLKEYLKSYEELIIVGEANNGVDAVKVINTFKPDLIFLDVQMPGLTGFEVLTHLEEIPKIIFSTAFDKYALQAFEVHAVDYLLKPYTKERFNKAVHRVRQSKESNPLQPLAQSLLMEKNSYPERILVEKGEKLITIAAQDIVWIEAFGDYSKLHTKEASYLSNFGISKLNGKLRPDVFIRVHRSSIVNLECIKELNKHGKSYTIHLTSGDEVRVSRGYKDNLKDLMF